MTLRTSYVKTVVPRTLSFLELRSLTLTKTKEKDAYTLFKEAFEYAKNYPQKEEELREIINNCFNAPEKVKKAWNDED